MHYKCDTCGKIADLLPELQSDAGSSGDEGADAKPPTKYTAQIAQLHMHSLEPGTAAAAAEEKNPGNGAEAAEVEVDGSTTAGSIETHEAEPVASSAPAVAAEPQAQVEPEEMAPLQANETVAAPATAAQVATASVITRAPSSVDTFLHYFTIACVVALLALVYKKLLKMQGVLP